MSMNGTLNPTIPICSVGDCCVIWAGELWFSGWRLSTWFITSTSAILRCNCCAWLLHTFTQGRQQHARRLHCGMICRCVISVLNLFQFLFQFCCQKWQGMNVSTSIPVLHLFPFSSIFMILKRSCLCTGYVTFLKWVGWLQYYTVSQNETRIIVNILYSCKSIAVKFSTWYPDDLSH